MSCWQESKRITHMLNFDKNISKYLVKIQVNTILTFLSIMIIIQIQTLNI